MAPTATGSMYERRVLSQPRIAGSQDTYRTRTRRDVGGNAEDGGRVVCRVEKVSEVM